MHQSINLRLNEWHLATSMQIQAKLYQEIILVW